MAIIELSGIISSLRGSIGGTTFSSNGAGIIAKRKIDGLRTFTQKQGSILTIHSQLTGLWQRLSLANKDLWNMYATTYTKTDRYGKTKKLTGYNWYCSINYNNLLLYNTITDTPPTNELPVIIPSFTVNCTGEKIELEFSLEVDTSERSLAIFTTPPSHTSALIPRSQLRYTTKSTDEIFTTIDLTSEWESTHNMIWNNLTNMSHFNIGVFIVPIDNTSLIEGVGTNVIGEWNNQGIGSMIIENNFKVG